MASTFQFRSGTKFAYRGKLYEIEQFVGLDRLRLVNISDGEVILKSKSEILLELTKGNLQVLDDSRLTNKRAYTNDLSKVDLSMLPQRLQTKVRRKALYVMAVKKAGITYLTQSALEPIIQDTAVKIGDDSKPGWVSVYRWIRAISKADDMRALIPANWQKGNRHKRKPTTVHAITDNTINTYYLTKERPSINSVVELINAKIDEENEFEKANSKSEAIILPHVTYKTVFRKIKKLDPYLVAKARHGERYADQQYKVCSSGPRPTRLLERVEMDHTKLDLFVVDDRTGMVYGRPWITVAIDVYSRSILGYFISFESPSALTVLACLEHAIWPKGDLKAKYPDLINEWHAAGIPETVAFDNGKEFVGINVENACMSLGINIEFCPVQEPWYKGTVERFFGSINTRLIHNLPGTTFSNIFEKGDYDANKNAVITYELLEWLVTKWIVDVYHQEVHRTTGVAPAMLWEKSLADFEPRYAKSARELNTFLGYTEERTVTRQGIQLDNLFYSCPELVHLRSINAGSGKFTIKYDPKNLGQIQIFDPSKSEWILVPAVDQDYAEGLSIWQHKVHRRYAAFEYGKVNQENLRKAKKQIIDVVNIASKRIKKTGIGQKIARYLHIGMDKFSFTNNDESSTAVAEIKVSRPKKSKKNVGEMIDKITDHPIQGISDIGIKIAKPVKEESSRLVRQVELDETDDDLELPAGFSVSADLPERNRERRV